MADKEMFSTGKKGRGGGWGSLIPEGQPCLPHLFSRLEGNSPAGTTHTLLSFCTTLQRMAQCKERSITPTSKQH